jgi:Fe-S-cluster-containing hydrogenase component 2
MIAQYGYKDGSGTYYISIDTEKCDGCTSLQTPKCIEVCPSNVFEVGEDEIDPFREEPVARVREEERKKLRFSCAVCKPAGGWEIESLPCVKNCPKSAIMHSW